jgi:formiminotetrahydrofolate cyclodeaminase
MLADRPFNDLLDALAADQPAPGGGTGAAWACALAAALVEMATAFTRHERLEQVRDRARELRVAALELAERDLNAYAPVLEALRLPADDAHRGERLEAALSAAADPPLAVAEAAAEVAALAAVLARTGNPHLRGDSITGATLAEAACRAAVSLVEINLARQAQDPRLARAAELAARAADARAQALGRA